MSAFVVSRATMDRVVSDYCKENYYGRGWGQYRHAEELDAIGQKLFRMNCTSVNQRYGENEFDPLCETYRFSRYDCPWSAVERFKAMCCLRYQSCEGDVPETNPLYTELDQRIAKLAHEIVCELPEYRAADWDAGDATDAVNALEAAQPLDLPA